MSKTEIIEELPKLNAEELAEIQAKLDELAGTAWRDRGELGESEKSALAASVSAYQASPDEGSAWDEVKARIEAQLQ